MKLSTNEVTLIGFVGGDAQARETRHHNKYAVVSLAITTGWWAGRRLAIRWSASLDQLTSPDPDSKK